MNAAQAWTMANAAVDRLGSADRTVAAKIVAARFVERCAASAAAGDWSNLAEWVDAACDRYAGIMPATDVIAAALEGVARALDDGDSRTARAFGTARADVHALLARPRAGAGPAPHEAVDEVDVVLDGLLTRLDQTDVLTAEHSRAVASWCARLGKRMHASKTEIVHLTRAGLVHDIGKVTTPAAILSAPRRLDDEEMTLMRDHARAGAEIVERVPLIANLVPAVRNHHERFDGSGYPDRLKWDSIPQVARIVAVADAFNAMIGRRPYRPPLAPSEALERLVAGRGDQFDPDIVDAMVDVVTKRA
ncbi:MAG TPA: HD domain-containing phosphohydrolase [Dongiaceae bacterium]|nr:HD domain-containing phosphohydrolase [Dongiaceae bacterium]